MNLPRAFGSFCLLPLWLAACGSSSSPADAGPVLSAQAYFNLQPGLCFEYAPSGQAASVGLSLQAVASPAGVAVHRTSNGSDQHVDFLSFDAGLALLAEQSFVTSGLTYAPPLDYLSTALANGTDSLTSASTASDGSGAQLPATLAVDVLGTRAYTGLGADAGSTSYQLSFAFQAGDGGSAEEAWITPGVGFTDLYLADDTGAFSDYLLTAVHPDDAGACPAQ